MLSTTIFVSLLKIFFIGGVIPRQLPYRVLYSICILQFHRNKRTRITNFDKVSAVHATRLIFFIYPLLPLLSYSVED